MSLATNWRENAGVFVSERDGDDTTGNGSQANPYRSLRKAIEETTANPLNVNVRAGYYNEGDILTTFAVPTKHTLSLIHI